MKVEFTPAALAQLAGISAYLRERDPGWAARVAASIEAAVQTIAAHPYTGRRQEVETVRKKVVTSSGHLIFYTVLADEELVRILAVVHSAQRRPFSDA